MGGGGRGMENRKAGGSKTFGLQGGREGRGMGYGRYGKLLEDKLKVCMSSTL